MNTQTAPSLHPATRAALAKLALQAPRAPLKGRGYRRATFAPALRGLAAELWAAIPRNHRDEVAIDRQGKTERVISPEAARKAAKVLTALGAPKPTRASFAARPARLPFLLQEIGSQECRFFGTAAAAHEWAQSRGLTYRITRGGIAV